MTFSFENIQIDFRSGSQSKWVEKLGPNPFIMLHQLNMLAIEVNEKVLGNAYFQKFIKSTEHHFDVILIEDFFSDAYLMLGYKFNAPIVTICMSSKKMKIFKPKRIRFSIGIFFIQQVH